MFGRTMQEWVILATLLDKLALSDDWPHFLTVFLKSAAKQKTGAPTAQVTASIVVRVFASQHSKRRRLLRCA